jgi:flagellar hook-associated protein 3 FlgL
MSTSRVSTGQMFTNAQNHVANAREKEQVSSEKCSTQKQINRPSQDPSGWMLANHLKDDVSVRETLSKNAQVASHVLTATETIFEQAQEYVGRAYELAIANSGTPIGGATGRHAALTEIEGIYEGLLQTLNFRYGNRTLLAGHHSQGPAFDKQGNFLGDSGVLAIDIDKDTEIPLTLSAERHILGQGEVPGVNILGAFQRLMQGLGADDTNLIQSTLEDMKQGIEQLSTARAEVGTRMQNIDRALGRHASHLISTSEQVSKIEDADAVKAFSDLARDQTILKAAISTSEKILHENPADIFFK